MADLLLVDNNRLLLQAIAEGVYITDGEGRIVFLNDAATRILGFSEKDILGKHEHEVFHGSGVLEESTERQTCRILQCLQDGKTRRLKDEFFWTSQKRKVPVECSVVPLKIENAVTGLVVIFSDMTGRVLYQNALKRAKEDSETLFQLVPSAVFTVDAQRRIMNWNHKAEEVTGYSASEAFGRTCDFFAVNPCKAHCGLFDKDIKKPLQREKCIIRVKGGGIKHILKNAGVILNDKDEVVGGIESFEDVTDIREAEDKLRLFSVAAEQSPAAFIITDTLGRIEYVNQKFCEVTGYSREEVLGKNPRILKSGEVQPQVYKDLWDTLAKGETWRGEFHNRRKDGALFWESAAISGIRDSAGNIVKYLAVKEEITEKKIAENLLREQQATFRAVTGSAQDAIIMMDNEGNVSLWNEAAERILGWSNSEVAGKNLHAILVHERFLPAYNKAFASFKYTGAGNAIGKTLELTAKKKSGDEIPVELSLSAVKLKDKWCAVGILRDITGRKQAEAELKKSKDEAEAANRAKSDFLANMSHEIRTPMNSVLGMVEVLQESQLSTEQQKQLKTVQTSAESLLFLINDILDHSKIEAGLLKIEKQRYSPAALASSVAEMLSVRAHTKGVSFTVKTGPAVPDYVLGDENRIRQILVNLVGNAIKFTQNGSIVLDISAVPGENKLLFAVSDTGIGISAENQKKLFRKFSQVDDSITRKYGGTGLGLSISKTLAELMGGNLSLVSSEGEGSVFTLSLLLEKAESAPVAAAQASKATALLSDKNHVDHLRILVAEDNPDNQNLIKLILSGAGYKFDIAANGKQVLEYCARFIYDLVLMDIQMPEMDGYEAAAGLRKIKDYENVPVIALTAHGLDSDISRSLAAGMKEHLTKPFKKKTLLDSVARWIDCRKKVLIVDDDADNAALLKNILKNETDLKVYSAGNGAQALAVLGRHECFSLVLMDLEMPVMDGLSALKAIRRSAHGSKISVLAYSADNDTERIRTSLEAGFNGYLVKPLKKAELIAKVRSALSQCA